MRPMLVRCLALVCLFSAGAPLAHSGGPVRESVAVYLKTKLSPTSPALSQIKADLVAIMAAVNVRVQWTDASHTGGFPGELVVLKLDGHCETPAKPPAGPPLENLSSLASTASSEGEILPFSSVDCDALAQFVGNSLSGLPPLQHRYLYSRAIARLAGHELYHALSKRSDHADEGIAKSAFSLQDLLFDNSFAFEHSFVAAPVRQPAASSRQLPLTAAEHVEASGR